LKGLAQEAFEYANNPSAYLYEKVLGISRKFTGIAGLQMNEIGTRMDDPIHLEAGHDGDFLIMARDQEKLRFIFNTCINPVPVKAICANSIETLNSKVRRNAPHALSSLTTILGNMSGGYGGL